jgi:UDP-N-acetylmuramate--alanine ligase
MDIFTQFKNNTKGKFVVNQSNFLSAQLSVNPLHDFSVDENNSARYATANFHQSGFTIQFTIDKVPFSINTVGKHNMENAVAATCVANLIGVSLQDCAQALNQYEGIYRRHQVLGEKNGVWVIDDYAHNPAKCAASIAACQYISPKVIAWFQPHGYGPTRFLRTDFVKEILNVLRPTDEIWMSEIFYAGGTAVKDISSNDLIADIKQLNVNAFFVEDRNDFLTAVRPHLTENCVLLLMGARDPSLEEFGKQIWENL